jgi:hypothetical protein
MTLALSSMTLALSSMAPALNSMFQKLDRAFGGKTLCVKVDEFIVTAGFGTRDHCIYQQE